MDSNPVPQNIKVGTSYFWKFWKIIHKISCFFARRKFLEFWKPKSLDIVLKIHDFSNQIPESGTWIPDEILISDFGKSGSRPRKTTWVSYFRKSGRLVPCYIPKAGTEPAHFSGSTLIWDIFSFQRRSRKFWEFWKANKLKFLIF